MQYNIMLPFEGVAKSISITSEKCMFLWHLVDNAVIKQTLSINDKGFVYFREHYVSTTLDKKGVRKHRFKIVDAIAKGIIQEVSNYFASCDDVFQACDAGDWTLKIKTIDGQVHSCWGSMFEDNPRFNFISKRIRQVTNNGSIWAFDGAED